MAAVGRIALCVLISIGTRAWADDAQRIAPVATIPVDSRPTEPASELPIFEDVIVTATKREEPSRAISGSVAAFNGEDVERIGARDEEDWLKFVPGVTLFKDEPNRNRITIRGIAADNGTSQAAGILIDDVPFTDPFIADLSPDLAPFDLNNVEVMKGPQGTLFGASGLAGAIRYVLQPAQLHAWEARGFFNESDAAHGQRAPAYGVAVNAPILDDRLALRFVGTAWDRPGVVDEAGRHEADVDRSRQISYRALLAFAPTERFDAKAIHLKQETSTSDLGFVDDRSGNLSRNSTPTASPIESKFSLDELTLNYAFDGATLTSATGHATKFLDVNADTTRATPGTRQFARATVDGYTQELRLTSPNDAPGPWQWLAGAFLMRYGTFRRVDVFADTATVAGAPLPQTPYIPGTVGLSGGDTGLVARFDLDATAKEVALFGEITRTFGSNIDLTMGLRTYRTDSTGVATASGPLNVALTGRQMAQNNADLPERGVNPKLALKFRWTESALAYALVSRGFRFGGIQLIGDTPTQNIPPTYKSDHVRLYEAGLRTDWLERKVYADATLYRMDWIDPQLTQLTQSGTLLYIDNVGSARVNGAELALRWLTPLRRFAVAATAAYTDSRTAEAFTASSGTNIPAGARWPFTASHQLAADASYEALFGSWRVAPDIVYSYQGRGYSNIENTVPVFDYGTIDAHLRVGNRELPGSPELTLAANNLLDKRGVASDVLSNGTHTIYYVRPFMAGVQLSLRF